MRYSVLIFQANRENIKGNIKIFTYKQGIENINITKITALYTF